MRCILLVLFLLSGGMTTEAALTITQYRTHVLQLIKNGVQSGSTNLIEMAVTYGRVGADEREAAVRFLADIYEAQVGVSPTVSTTERHRFKHWVEDVVSGEGFEP